MKSKSAKKLNELLDRFIEVLEKWEGDATEEALMSTIHLSEKHPPPGRPERNRLLKERRRVTWDEKEEEQKNAVLSANLQDTKDFYCGKIGLNPFHLAARLFKSDPSSSDPPPVPLPPSSTDVNKLEKQ